jgi:hypothetical protein
MRDWLGKSKMTLTPFRQPRERAVSLKQNNFDPDVFVGKFQMTTHLTLQGKTKCFPYRFFQRRLFVALAGAVLLAPGLPAGAEEATPLESIQIMSGNYRKGGDAGVIGHLGGVPVSIPKEFAKFVEYDGDPGFLEKRKGPVPKRTFESGICSFGFDIRYPDMMPVNEQTWREKRKENIYTTMWMHVGILSNSTYGYDGPDKITQYAKLRLEDAKRWHRYEKQTEKRHGLTVFAPVDIDLLRRNLNSTHPKGSDFHDINIYFDQTKDGTIGAFIYCSNINHEAALCEHRFDLRPEMKANVNIGYRKGLLPHWREIQDSVTMVLLGFRVHPNLPDRHLFLPQE